MEKISYSSSSKRIGRSISFSKSPGETPSPRPRRMIIRALGSRLEFSSLFRYSSAIPVLLASWYCDIWRDSRILTSADPNRHSCSHILFFTFIVSSFSLKISKKTPASTPVAITNFTALIIPGNCVPFSTFWRLL